MPSTHSTPPSVRRFLRIVWSCIAHLFIAATTSLGQEMTLSGVVVDGDAGTPLRGATVRLRPAGDSTARTTGAISGADGSFRIEGLRSDGTYLLEVSYVGYARLHREGVRPGHLDTLALVPAPTSSSVTVTADRADVTILADRTVYRVADNENFTGRNVRDLLTQIPAVHVDQNDKISVAGEKSVTVMIDGRPTGFAGKEAELLKILPAATVQDIEIIESPGPQFGSDAGAVVINIVSRRPEEGSFGVNLEGMGTTQGGLGGSAAGYLGMGPVAATASGGGDLSSMRTTGELLFINRNDSLASSDEARAERSSRSVARQGRAQVDLELSGSSLLSFAASAYRWDTYSTTHYDHTVTPPSGRPTYTYTEGTFPGHDDRRTYDGGRASLLFRHELAENRTLSIDLQYETRGNEQSTSFETNEPQAGETTGVLRGERSDWRRRAGSLVLGVAYDDRLADGTTIALGASGERSSLSDESSRNSERSAFGASSSIASVYGNVAVRLGPMFRLRGGLRLEHARIADDPVGGEASFSRTFTSLMPSASFAATLDEHNSLSLSYRRSVPLPSIEALSPAVIRGRGLQEMQGNPDLVAETNQRIGLSYNLMFGLGTMISVGADYGIADNSIEEGMELIEGTPRLKYANFAGTRTFGVDAMVMLEPAEWCNLRATVDVTRTTSLGGSAAGDIPSSATAVGGSSYVTLTPVDGLSVTLGGALFRSATVGAYTPSPIIFTFASLRTKLLDDALSVNLSMSDPFGLNDDETTFDGPDFSQRESWSSSGASVRLSLSYSFGHKPELKEHSVKRAETKGASSTEKP